MAQALPTVTPWACKRCGLQLGRVVEGVLSLDRGPVAVDRWGNAAVKCRRCGEVRFWRPSPCGKVHAATDN